MKVGRRMINHIVMWKLKEYAEGADKKSNALKIKTMLEALIGKIEYIDYLEVGININLSEAAYDATLYSKFKDLKALEDYQNHPEHKKVSEFVGKVREGRVVVDYEA
jgi:hypothetical protein